MRWRGGSIPELERPRGGAQKGNVTVPQTSPAPGWRAIVVTLFPELFPGPLAASLAGDALQRGVWGLDTVALRDFGVGRHRQVDDTPAGGGAGMVLRADVVAAALDAARAKAPDAPAIYLSPRGEPLTQALVRDFAATPGLILLAGRFEGLDQRVVEARALREVSIGDYVLSGGELAAMVLIDAVVRLLPGVVGKAASLAEESFEAGLLEYPHYTRPRDWEGRAVPEVLLSGDHKRIAEWRRAAAERLTRERRPDLWARQKK
jgi:tRNA (guanine37-N1)-methyltransferase